MKSIQRLFFIFVLAVFLSSLSYQASLPETAQAQSSDPVFVGAGDITNCNRNQDEETAKLLDNISGTVFTVGDNAYPDGTASQFSSCYGPTWGRHKNRTRPAAGNHDYHVNGAAGYYGYFGSAASPLDNNCTSNCKGYYSYNLGAWHIIALNSEVGYSAGSAQVQWLRADLAANQNVCTLAYWHHPRFSSGQHGNLARSQPFWDALYEYGADVVINGHDHTYERFAPQDPNGQSDPNRGIREFVAGTGGAGLYPFPTIQPNSQVRNNTTYGVLKLTLHATSYDWQFVPIAGQTFTDSGSSNCVGGGTNPTLTRTPTSGPAPTATRTPTPGGPTATRTSTPSSSDLIFADSFESGNLSAWSSSTTDGGDLGVSSTSALVGTRGLQAVIDDNNPVYMTDDRPNAEPRYRARFYFDPNSISMTNGDMFFIFNGLESTSTAVTRVDFRRESGIYQLRARILDDASNWIDSNWFTISDASHFIELDWQAATSAGANNGSLTFWIDGVQQANLSGVNNDSWRIDRVRLGAVSGVDSGTRGTYYLDAFESRRQSYIGPAGGASTPPPPTPTLGSTSTNPPGPTATRTPTATQTRTSTATPVNIHIGDLDRVTTNQSGKWTAIVTITVHDANHNPVANATVSGAWSNGASGSASCVTGSNGQCTVSVSNISKSQNSVTFTVNNITRPASIYTSVNNHDPESDSNGTRIVINNP